MYTLPTIQMPTLIRSKPLYDNNFLSVLDEEWKQEDGTYISRTKVKKKNSAAVVLYNQDTGCFILVEQFRHPTGRLSIEIPAGHLDDHEDGREAAMREALEETGYKILRDNIRFLGAYYLSPGILTEGCYIYAAVVSSDDRIHSGGGVASESENIRVIEYNIDSDMLEYITDAKSMLGITLFKQKFTRLDTQLVWDFEKYWDKF